MHNHSIKNRIKKTLKKQSGGDYLLQAKTYSENVNRMKNYISRKMTPYFKNSQTLLQKISKNSSNYNTHLKDYTTIRTNLLTQLKNLAESKFLKSRNLRKVISSLNKNEIFQTQNSQKSHQHSNNSRTDMLVKKIQELSTILNRTKLKPFINQIREDQELEQEQEQRKQLEQSQRARELKLNNIKNSKTYKELNNTGKQKKKNFLRKQIVDYNLELTNKKNMLAEMDKDYQANPSMIQNLKESIENTENYLSKFKGKLDLYQNLNTKEQNNKKSLDARNKKFRNRNQIRKNERLLSPEEYESKGNLYIRNEVTDPETDQRVTFNTQQYLNNLKSIGYSTTPNYDMFKPRNPQQLAVNLEQEYENLQRQYQNSHQQLLNLKANKSYSMSEENQKAIANMETKNKEHLKQLQNHSLFPNPEDSIFIPPSKIFIPQPKIMRRKYSGTRTPEESEQIRSERAAQNAINTLNSALALSNNEVYETN